MNQVSFDTMDKLCQGLDLTVNDIVEYVPESDMTLEDWGELKERDASVNKYRRNKS